MKIEFTASAIANLINGKVDGNPNQIITGISKIDQGQSNTLSFLSNMAYEHFLYDTLASVIIVNNDFKPSTPIAATLIRVDNPYMAFAGLLEIYYKKMLPNPEVHKMACIEDSCEYDDTLYVGAFAYIGKNTKIGKNVYIYPNVYIGDNVNIGDNSVINPGATIYRDCIIGNNCTIHSGAVVGADGFGFVPNTENCYKKVPQTGNVIVEDYVEIGANTTIDRATIGSTIIRKGVKLDNLIQLAHNVEVDENTVIAAQSGVSGSTYIGKNCMVGGQVGIIGHTSIADETKIAAQSGIGHAIKETETIVQGSPAFNIKEYQKSYVLFKKLPELLKKINQLENKIKELENCK